MAAVHGALRAEGGLLAQALGPEPTQDGALGAAAAAGPRSAGHEAEHVERTVDAAAAAFREAF